MAEAYAVPQPKHQNRVDSQEELPGVALEWRHISYSVKIKDKKSKQTEKVLLDDISAFALPKRILAILGASGSGKTTLLNVISARVPEKNVKGEIFLNDEPLVNAKAFRGVLAFVMQDDVLNGNLTVREQLMYSALLRLPYSVPKDTKAEIVDNMLDELGLMKSADTRVGVPGLVRGISGGERKRTNVGVELVTNPRVLFGDEMTSGLDAKTAQNIIESLRRFATNKNATVVTTIHQPRSNIFDMFDDLLLLAQGRVAYFGKARLAINWFESLGYPLPERYNPADWFIDLITETTSDLSGDKSQIQLDRERIDYILAAYQATSESVRSQWTYPRNQPSMPESERRVSDQEQPPPPPTKPREPPPLHRPSGPPSAAEGQLAQAGAPPSSKLEKQPQQAQQLPAGPISLQDYESYLASLSFGTAAPAVPLIHEAPYHPETALKYYRAEERDEDQSGLPESNGQSRIASLTQQGSISDPTSSLPSRFDVDRVALHRERTEDREVPPPSVFGRRGPVEDRVIMPAPVSMDSGQSRLFGGGGTHKVRRREKKAKAVGPMAVPAAARYPSQSEAAAAKPYPTPWHYQFKVLFDRNFKATVRDRISTWGRVFQVVFISTLLGLVYLQIGFSQQSVQNRLGVLFFIGLNVSFTSLFAVINTFPSERAVLLKERASGMYRISAYFLAKTFCDIPFQCFYAILFVSICYYMIGLKASFWNFTLMVITIIIATLVAQAMGLAISASSKTIATANILGPLVLIFFLLFAGFYRSTKDVPVYFIWVPWLSFVRYLFQALILNEFTGLTFTCTDAERARGGGNCPIPDGQTEIEILGFTDFGILVAEFALFGLWIFFLVIAYLLLRFVQKPKGAY